MIFLLLFMNFYYSDFVMKRKEKNGRVWTEVQNELGVLRDDWE